MSEIKREPIYSTDGNGDELATFDANHTLGDIARWICKNRSEAEDICIMINAILNGTEGMALQ